jgi:hypothetical protein
MNQAQIENVRTVQARQPWVDKEAERLAAQPVPKASRSKAHLQKPEVQKRFTQMLCRYIDERDYQSDNRVEMATDQDFRDGIQWTEEEMKTLRDRNQAPLVFNKIKPAIAWITGSEKRTRVDFKVVPRGKEDADGAESKTKLLKYVHDVNRQRSIWSRAFDDGVSAGVGWVEEGINPNPLEEKLFVRYENWRNVHYDHLSVEPDMSDARFLFRSRSIDLDVAKMLFKGHERVLEAAAENQSYLTGMDDDDLRVVGESRTAYVDNIPNGDGTRRQRVRLVECWYKNPEVVQILGGNGPFRGCWYNKQDQVLVWAVENGLAPIVGNRMMMVMRHMIFTAPSGMETEKAFDGELLHEGPLPYWHNRFPLTPVWGYRRKRDNAPYGAVRNLRDPQVDLNKARSKAQFILATNQVIADEGAVDDVDELAEEVARPDGIIFKKSNKNLEIRNDKTLAEEYVNLMGQDAQYISEVSGITDELMGRKTNAVSGAAIERRQEQGSLTTLDLFDNLRLARQISGEKQLCLIEQYYDEEKTFRLTNERGNPEYTTINGEGESGEVLNPVTAAKADFIIDERAYHTSVRQAMYETMMELITALAQGGMAQAAMALLDIALEMADIPMRDEVVARVRKITGQRPDDEELSEEEKAELDEQQKQDQELQMRKVMAELEKLEGEAKEALGKGNTSMAKALTEKLDGMKQALEISSALHATPALGTMADDIMDDAARGIPAQNNNQ